VNREQRDADRADDRFDVLVFCRWRVAGMVPGIHIDLDRFNGSANDLRAFATGALYTRGLM
jgi:hypothetical protein